MWIINRYNCISAKLFFFSSTTFYIMSFTRFNRKGDIITIITSMYISPPSYIVNTIRIYSKMTRTVVISYTWISIYYTFINIIGWSLSIILFKVLCICKHIYLPPKYISYIFTINLLTTYRYFTKWSFMIKLL